MNCKSKTIRALGVRYHRLSGREIIECIEKELAAGGNPLSDAQMSRLKELWDYGDSVPFQAYDWDREKDVKTGFLWRISAVPLVLWVALLFAFIPFVWLATGRAHYRPRDGRKGIVYYTAVWMDKCFGRD